MCNANNNNREISPFYIFKFVCHDNFLYMLYVLCIPYLQNLTLKQTGNCMSLNFELIFIDSLLSVLRTINILLYKVKISCLHQISEAHLVTYKCVDTHERLVTIRSSKPCLQYARISSTYVVTSYALFVKTHKKLYHSAIKLKKV